MDHMQHHHQQQQQHQQHQQQFSQNSNMQFGNLSHMLNDTSHFDVQSELESLFVNATLSDVTLTSNITGNSDENSNNSSSTKLTVTDTVDDELCDIEMNLNFINTRNESESKVSVLIFELKKLI
jgi:hypothetical protein